MRYLVDFDPATARWRVLREEGWRWIIVAKFAFRADALAYMRRHA